MRETILQWYAENVRFADLQIRKYERLANAYSVSRLLAILGGGLLIWQTLRFENVWLTELGVLFFVLGFAWLVKQQSKYERKKAFFIDLKKVNENETGSIRFYRNMYDDGSAFIGDSHNYTSDLDIFGPRSLFNLLNRCASPMGNRMLAEWLRSPASSSSILARQAAVAELTGKKAWMQEFQAAILFARGSSIKEVENLFAYLEMKSPPRSAFLKGYIRLIPFLFLIFSATAFFIPQLAIAVLALVIANAGIVFSQHLEVNRADRLLTAAGKTLGNYSDAFARIESEVWTSELCSALSLDLQSDRHQRLSEQLRHLGALAGKLEVRFNIFVGPFLNGIMAWDVRQLLAIEEWKQRNRAQLEKAFEVVAHFESLVSLASARLNYPEWCFPEIAETPNYTYATRALGHPLIPQDKRVCNDFSLEDELKIDIITGSNMAGKSTFLRTLGINGVLALCGAPVCAAEMRISNMDFFTYMRIRDSLNESTSTFRAELNRLQLLLDEQKAGGKVYFLIDEMLRGTNSVDKYLGSKAIIETLIARKGVGVVATHDLQIADLEEKYPDYIRNFYFDIQVHGTEMFFDYKFRNGKCKTFNASLLLRQLGIRVED